jgi:hypothetical protein
MLYTLSSSSMLLCSSGANLCAHTMRLLLEIIGRRNEGLKWAIWYPFMKQKRRGGTSAKTCIKAEEWKVSDSWQGFRPAIVVQHPSISSIHLSLRCLIWREYLRHRHRYFIHLWDSRILGTTKVGDHSNQPGNVASYFRIEEPSSFFTVHVLSATYNVCAAPTIKSRRWIVVV